MKNQKWVIRWLLSGCVLIFIMVIVGGITRLTHSGLSMVNWHLFMGAIPPLNEVDWHTTFNLYKQYPEYQKVNFNCTIEEFKKIFFWEYLHRMIGRLLGLVFIIPFIFFLIRKSLSKKLILQSLFLFILGSLQGFIGWWMVKSGLVDKPDVSHYRLAIHLTTAFLTCGYILWVVLPLIFNSKRRGYPKIQNLCWSVFYLLVLQIIYGAFVAGLNAGIGFNTWPKMGNEWIPEAVYALKPFWRNFVEAKYGVQFIHRILAFIILILVLLLMYIKQKYKLTKQENQAIIILSSVTSLQIFLGILTLIFIVPIPLALIHQLCAFLLLMSTVYCLFIFQKS
jgi:cytochrome c oxidase assembly protein subunit 15